MSSEFEKIHYVYRITNKVMNCHYYGVRSSLINPTDDLGITYFSSSTDKDFIKDQKKNPQNYKYKIIKIFASRKEANDYEIYLHKKFLVSLNNNFYNKSMATSTGFCTYGTKRSSSAKKKTSEKLKKYKRTKEHQDKITKSKTGVSTALKGTYMSEENKIKLRKPSPAKSHPGETNGMYGKKHSDETKLIMSNSRKGENNSFYGKTHTDEVKNKIRESNSRIVICPYCKKEGKQSGMNRWHFENCKFKG